MDKRQQLQQLLTKAKSGGRPVGVSCVLSSPSVPELVARFGFDFLIINTEHTFNGDPLHLANMIRSAEIARVPIFVKLNKSDPLLARNAADAGAHGVIAPFIESADQLREFIDGCRFPPVGTRGFCSAARATWYASGLYSGRPETAEDYIEFINEDFLVIPIVETLDGMNDLEEILTIQDCPIIHMGLEDLALSLASDKRDFAYTMRVAQAACKKIRAAGRVVMSVTEPRTDDMDGAILALERLGNGMPYVPDALCLGYGLAQTLKLVQESRERTSDESAAENADSNALEVEAS